MKHRILAFVCSIAAAFTASAQVPSLINYQGRLTDSNGAPVTGSKNFAISIYDAATGGNLLYEETIGAVTLDANGVYSFQFGSAGSSNTQVTETIGTTAGSTLTYTKTLTNTPVVNNSITVTDGTNSWSQSVGNPGVGATATANTISGFVIGATITNGGSGYTSAPAVTITGAGTGATASATLTDGVVTGITIISAGSGYTGAVTITIDPPVIPFRVDYSAGSITAAYSSVPTPGLAINATYRYTRNGITGALSAGVEHWMSVSVNGIAQASRQRVLAVPFAAMAERSKSTDESSLFASTQTMSLMLDEIALAGYTSSEHKLLSFKDDMNSLIAQDRLIPWVVGSGLQVTPQQVSASKSAGWDSVLITTIDNLSSRISKVKYTASTGSFEGHTEVKIFYSDGTDIFVGGPGGLYTNRYVELNNPNPEKIVTKIEYRGGNNRTGGGTITYTNASYEYLGNELSFGVNFASPLTGKEFVSYLDRDILSANPEVFATYRVRSGSNLYGPYPFGQKAILPEMMTINSIQVSLNGNFATSTPPITKFLLRRIR
jgi:hypothetical protein